jgi:hypothetical protein
LSARPVVAALAAATAALGAAACGGEEDPQPTPQPGGAATVVTVADCLARAGARPAVTAADLEFAQPAVRGQVGAGLDGRTTYEFLPPEPAPGGDWRVYRTRPRDAPPPRPEEATEAPAPAEEVATLPPPAKADAIRRAQGCTDGAPE